jgi:hypothetical protein
MLGRLIKAPDQLLHIVIVINKAVPAKKMSSNYAFFNFKMRRKYVQKNSYLFGF